LDDQVACEAARRLDNDGPHAVAEEALQHGGEPRPLVNCVSAGHRRVIELFDNLISR
jgi:hypothetical protein